MQYRLVIEVAMVTAVGAVVGCHAPDRAAPDPYAYQSARPARVPQPQHVEPSATTPAHLAPVDALPSQGPQKPGALTLVRHLAEEPPELPATAREPQSDDDGENEDSQDEEDPFRVPDFFPGADAEPLTLPKLNPDLPAEKRRDQLEAIYGDIPAPPMPLDFGASGHPPMTLAELQQIAFANSPRVAAAAARIDQARGEAIQAGLCPNPETGYVADSINTAETAGYNGIFLAQRIITADKRDFARTVEWQDVIAAEFELRQVQIEVATDVRRAYFQALIAQERLRFSGGLVDLFRRGYEAQIDLVNAGEAAAYEPLQLRVFALQSRNAAIVAANDYIAAWRQLAAVLNMPDLPCSELAGSPEMPVPRIDYKTALAHVLSNHTRLGVAAAEIARAEWDMRLQRRIPIPNVDLEGAIQHDDTSPENEVAFNVLVSVPVPVFDRNQGNILTAYAELAESRQNFGAVQNDLAGQLAEVYARYASNQALAESYREEIIPDQVRIYRGLYLRFREGIDTVDFAQVVVTQQQLGQVVGEYLDVLTAQWRAVVDLAELLQTDDLFHLDLACDPHIPTESLELPPGIPTEPAPAPEPEQEAPKPAPAMTRRDGRW